MFQIFNPLNAELNSIRHLLALVGARHIVHVSRIRVNYLPFSLHGPTNSVYLVSEGKFSVKKRNSLHVECQSLWLEKTKMEELHLSSIKTHQLTRH